MDRWSYTRAAFDEHYQPLRDLGYTLEMIEDLPSYWKLQEAELKDDFPDEVFFDLKAVRTAHERAGQDRLAAARGDVPLRNLVAVRDGAGALVAMFSGQQQNESLYRMWHSTVRTDVRRRGIYRRIVDGTIGYTRALGFDAISSEHAPCNNPILIAKLRAGFRIYGFEIDPMAGPSITLRYFHNADHLAAYELRCGLATLTPALRARAFGAFTKLRDQAIGDGTEPGGRGQ
jgi:hypothetical protein